ncbi:MAG: CvpA family protein [Desulfarculales bacterium]|jgi:membrane protein required for colicin V production|nr:CvpA family protein [Desulfarculales bacterium]
MLEHFNILDWAMILIGAVFVVRALYKGLLREFGNLAGLLLAVGGGFLWYQPVAQFLRRVVGVADFWWEAVAFLLCFFLIYLLIIFIAGRISKVLHRSSLSFIDRALGACLGILKSIVICYLLVNILLMVQPFVNFPADHKGSEEKTGWVSDSYLAPIVVQGGRLILAFIPDDFIVSLQERAGLIKEQALDTIPPQLPPSR